ncbi:hypothetical protein BGZ70_001227 [Mortierella alpina]|uniref:Uncharacterized protein n=1 Tax=Mortierella alpina TaxID=64518 RepID=A0A9P6IWG5_MORAP|nr:hypothetical protein BGZ70_001227 [Mortierella alpina]
MASSIPWASSTLLHTGRGRNGLFPWRPTLATSAALPKPIHVPTSNKAYAHDWTLESNAMLLNLREQGLSWREVGLQLSKSDAACLKHYNNVLAPALADTGRWHGNTALDKRLLETRLLEKRTWQEVGQVLQMEARSCQARFKGALEPWLKAGWGHGKHTPTSRPLQKPPPLRRHGAGDVYIQKVKGAYDAILEEQGLKVGEIQGWYDRYLVTTLNPKVYRAMDQIWTKEMDHVLVKMRREDKAAWPMIQEALGMDYPSCYIRYHRITENRLPVQVKLKGAELRQSLQELYRGVLVGHGSLSDFWTPERDEILLRMKEETPEVTWREIGQKLGTSYVNCHTRYKAVLQPLIEQSWTARTTAQLQEMVEQGQTWDDISNALGIHRRACKQQWLVINCDRDNAAKAAKAMGERAGVIGSTYTKILQQRIERNYDGRDWDQLLCAQSVDRPAQTEEQKRQQRHQWLEKNPAWTPLEETRLIQRVLKSGLNAWDNIAEALNTEAERSRHFTAVECRIRWKNLDMPVHRGIDLHDWTPSNQRLFWSTWLHYREASGMDRTEAVEDDIWERISQDPRVPGDKEQCRLYFETATWKLESLSENSLTTFAQRQVNAEETRLSLKDDLAENGTHKPRYQWSKRRSAMLQRFIQLEMRQPSQQRRKTMSWPNIIRRINRRPQDQESHHDDDDDDDAQGDGVLDLRVSQCIFHWKRHLKLAPGPRWTHSEVKLLEQGIRELGYNWRKIQERYLPWRQTSMLIPQWYLISERPARITVDEYMSLLGIVEELRQQQPQQQQQQQIKATSGDDLQPASCSLELRAKDRMVDWREVAARMPGWTANPCRRVFEQSYKYVLEHADFTPEEDAWLLTNVQLGREQDWAAVVKRFGAGGRTAWHYRLRWCQLLDL